MRENLRANAVQLLDGERRNEQARIAADVHDRIIQRVFALGLGLTSAPGDATWRTRVPTVPLRK
jgi:signal transduction histidine kinase